MVSFGGINLGGTGAAVFELTSKSDDEELIQMLPDGTAIIVPASSRYVIVRGCPGDLFGEVHANARESANRGMDLIYGQGGPPLVMAQKDSSYMIAWTGPVGQTLRIVGLNQTSARFRATAKAFDANGNPVPPSAPPPKIWHESLRYYRVSESSVDLYDSFRNLYLAIEALLSDVTPPLPKPSGRAEGDGEWLERAIRSAAGRVDLSPFAPISAKSPHNAIYDELYATLRTAIFHAKSGRAAWMPQDWSSRERILEARIRYAQMFRRLAAEFLDIPYPAGGFAKGFWERTWREVLVGHEVFVSNDPTRTIDEARGNHVLSPSGGDFITLPTAAADDMAGDWCLGVTGTAAASSVHRALGSLYRFGTLQDGEVMMVESLDLPLVLDDLAVVDVVLLVQGRNHGQPRQDFES
jgi:hypothetical protein